MLPENRHFLLTIVFFARPLTCSLVRYKIKRLLRQPPTQTFLRVRHAIIPPPRGAGTRDEPLRMSAWEATATLVSFAVVFLGCHATHPPTPSQKTAAKETSVAVASHADILRGSSRDFVCMEDPGRSEEALSSRNFFPSLLTRKEATRVKHQEDWEIQDKIILAWHNHIITKLNSANKILRLIKRTCGNWTQSAVILKLYIHLVRPHLEYACEIWSPYQAFLQDMIESVQRRATRLMIKGKSYTAACNLRNTDLYSYFHRTVKAWN